MGQKFNTYILTYVTYATVHMMRMAYSFNKHHIQTTFGIGSLFLGCMDAFIFLSLALGTLFRYSIINSQNLTLMCLQTAIPTALAFSLPAVWAIFKDQQPDNISSLSTYIVLMISSCSFGFFQFAFFPVTLTLFSQHFNLKKQGRLVGFWSSKSNFGNIVGFFIANFIVYQLGKQWYNSMFIFSIIHITLALLIYIILQNGQEDKDNITTHELFSFLKTKWRIYEFKLYILSFSFFKAILYTYELWTPIFLSHQGFAKYSGYVPMCFDISTLVGSFVIGKFYQQKQGQQINNVVFFIRKYKFVVASAFIFGISMLYLVIPPNIVVYFVLGISMGLFLGAVYNALQNNQILAYTQNKPRETDLLSTVNIGLGSALVGVFQLLIGVFLNQQVHEGEQVQTDHTGRIYYVIAFMSVVAMILTFLRVKSGYKAKISSQTPRQEKQMQQMKQKLVTN